MLAKIYNNIVEKAPYTLEDLLVENPYTQYDSPDVEALFPTTEEAVLRGAKLVKASIKEKPSFDPLTQKLVQSEFVYDPSTNTAISDWKIVDLTEQEAAQVLNTYVEQARENRKAQREISIKNIKVTTQSGKTFDGDEVSQTRMLRAIAALESAGKNNTLWTLADSKMYDVTLQELKEALILATEEQTKLWAI